MSNRTVLNDEELVGAIRRAFSSYRPLPASGLPVSARSRGFVRLGLVGIPVAGLLAMLVGQTIFAPTSAFATWTAVPVQPDPAIVAAVTELCHNAPLPSDMPPTDRAYEEELRSLPLVVVDQRGRAAVALFARREGEGQTSLMCLGSTNAAGMLVEGGAGGGKEARESPVDGPLRLFTAQRDTNAGREPYTAYAGSVASDVSKVVVERSRGEPVTAAVDNGYFVAWWPGEAYATKVTAFAQDGLIVSEIGNNGWTFEEFAQ